MLKRLSNERALLLLILLGAATARTIGLDWALPHTYEEATPLRVAVTMWGWQGQGATSLNPAFFNYPSLTFYLHFLAQGILFLALKLTGVIASVGDWYFTYLTDPTPQYLTARTVGVLLGVLTVWFAFKLGKEIAGARAGLVAAALIATNPYHVARSQMIEVDIPLTCFVVLAVYALVRITRHGRTSDYALAGVSIGLAASSKYTGALLVVPLLMTHFIAGSERRAWRPLLISLGLCAIVFAATSPYMFIDWHRAHADLALEREHMKSGHFGVGETASWRFYGHSLAARLVGLPGILLALIGPLSLFRRDPRSTGAVMAAMVVYLGVIMTWSMKADAYALPLVPLILVCTAAGIDMIGELAGHRLRNPRATETAVTVMLVVMVAINLTRIAGQREATLHDARTDAQNWVEANLPAGSFIVTESYGPDLLDPAFLLQLKPDLRARVLKRWEHRPIYAVTALPMFQSRPELSAVFYRPDLYPEADYVITTGSIRGRYAKHPERFAAQAAFYQYLDLHCKKVQEFDSRGARLTVYQTAPRLQPFGARAQVLPPPAIADDGTTRTGSESGFYFAMGTNYEFFQHTEQAAASYRLALGYGNGNRQALYGSAFGYARCLIALGRADEAKEELARFQAGIHDPQLKGAVERLLQAMNGVH